MTKAKAQVENGEDEKGAAKAKWENKEYILNDLWQRANCYGW